jgi:hypothetical protein
MCLIFFSVGIRVPLSLLAASSVVAWIPLALSWLAFSPVCKPLPAGHGYFGAVWFQSDRNFVGALGEDACDGRVTYRCSNG